MATGRGVLEVAHESFALTLYTFWHLEQRRRLDAVARRLERFDMAGMMADAFHKPSNLGDHYHEFVADLRPARAPDAPSGERTPAYAAQDPVARARQIETLRAAHAANVTVTTLTMS